MLLKKHNNSICLLSIIIMGQNNFIIKPHTVSFLTTYQCTLACKNCCFHCNPKMKQRLTLDEMKLYLDQSIKYYEDSLKVLVLTGGECTILDEDLLSIIEYGSKYGLIVRIVTNGHWAMTFEKAQVYLDENGFSNVKANLDESLLKTILAFSDERITHAIKSNDIQTFIKLCKELGLTNEVEEGDLTMVQGILAKVPELQNLISDLGISKDDENRAAIAWVFFALLAVVGACVFDWALAVSYAVEAVAAHTTAVFNTQVGYNTKTISSGIDNNSNQSKTKIQNASVTLLWLLKGGASNQLPYLWDEENKAFVDEIIQAIKKNYPDFSQDYNVEQIKSLFLLNLNLLT